MGMYKSNFSDIGEIKFVRPGKTIAFLLLTTFLFARCNPDTQAKGILEVEFANPSLENRPLAFWDWLNGYVDTAKMVYELEEMKAKGMQGAFIWDVGALADPGKTIPAGPAFLGETSLSYISLALQTGARLGLNLGMIASSSWNAGGDWIDKADASEEMLSSKQIVTGPSKKKIIIEPPKSRTGDAHLITAIAIPYSGSKEIDYTRATPIPLDRFTSEDKFIEWEVPEGRWEVISFFSCATGQPLECPSPNSNGLMIDHLSRRATKLHFDTILARLAKVSTPGNHLKFLEVDSYEVWPANDWTPGFIQEFMARYGYDPKPFLPILQGYHSRDRAIGERFRGDYSRLVSDLIIENHFAQSVDMAHANGMKMFAEAGHGGYPRVEPLKGLGNSDIPMGEFWNRQRFWVTNEAASAAHIYGKKVVAAESLTGWQHWQQGPTDYKQLFDIAFCAGLNQVVFHTFAHNPETAGKPGNAYHAGEHINVNTTWWEMARPFMDYLSRCSYMLRQGTFVGDVCIYYGDQAPNLVPPRRIDPNMTPLYDDSRCLHCGQPKPVNPGELSGYDFDYINADIITTALTAENGKLVLPSGQSYKVMLLPERDDMSLDVLKSLEKLVSDGAVVIGRRPERTTSLKNYPECDREVKAISEKLWGTCDGQRIFSNNYGKGRVYWGRSVEQVLEELKIRPDFEVEGIDNGGRHIDSIHRQTETEDIYFVSNSRQSEENVTCLFRVDKNRVPELWDAETGLIQRTLEYSIVENGIRIEFIMDPLASRFVVFRTKSTGKNDAGLNYDLQVGFHKNQKVARVYESLDITAGWDIGFDPTMGGPKSYHLEKLTSWPELDDDGIKYYSGKAIYSREFSIGEDVLSKNTEAFVAFEDIQEMARVMINGHDCGIVWTPPYKANITPYLKAGKNNIIVEVINTWNNRIVGDVNNPSGIAFAKTNIKNKFNKKSPLLKSGLMGKAQIVFTRRIDHGI
jgi:hypothetical protein